jgi:hypothetical protein
MDSKSKFISEKTIEENKRKRAEEWEKARADNKGIVIIIYSINIY